MTHRWSGSSLRSRAPASGPSGPVARAYAAVGDRLGETLEREMLAGEALVFRWTPSLLMAAAIAVAAYLLSLACVAAGILEAISGWPSAFSIVVGVLITGFGLMTCPKPVHRRRVRSGIDRTVAPQLCSLIDELARALGVRPPDAVRLDVRLNASWAHDGWRRRRVLTLGVPLLAALDAEQTVGLLAHELAHERNGDVLRGRWIGSSVASIASVVEMLRPQRTRGLRGTGYLGAVAANACVWLCAQPVRGLLALQIHLLYRDSQRAEYLADDLAASVAGTAAVIGVHDVLVASSAVETAIRRATIAGDRVGTELPGAIRGAVAEPDPGRVQERRRIARAQRRRLDSTHPTLASRIAVLEGRPSRPATVTLGDDQRSVLADELRALLTPLMATLLDHDRGRLYAGG